MLKLYSIVMLGGALGTGLRFWLSNFVTARHGTTFPWGTLAVNVIGSFIIGLIAGVTGPEGKFVLSPLTRQFVTIGILGGFTTFSSFSAQTVSLLSAGEWLRAGANIVLSVSLCLLVCWLGSITVSWLNR